MKRIILCFTAIILLFTNCNNECKNGDCNEEYPCKIDRPQNLKPIDWENYNDVHTVYWNTVHYCGEPNNIQGDTIMISGWRPWSYDFFYLCDEAKYADNSLGYTAAKPIVRIVCYLPEFSEKLDTCDLTKKCFIKGKLMGESFSDMNCNWIEPIIEITDINNIYFEE